jgi:DNA-binding protein HU-beta
VAESVNKAELTDRLAARLDITKKAAGEAIEAIVDEITKSVAKGDKVAISGFGVFEKADRAARVGRNPQTGATVKIKATSVPKFRAGAEFKNAVAGKKAAAKKAAQAKKAAPAKKAVAKKAAPAKKAAAKR